MLKQLIEFKKTDRKWHIPVLAGLSVGIPIMVGFFYGNFPGWKLASMAGLVILYIHSIGIAHRMATLMICSFGLMVSFSIGAILGFNPFVASLALGLYAFAVHSALYYLKLTKPPGNFFFIMIASVAICMPFQLERIPQNIGFVGIGTMISCILGLLYSFLTMKKLGSTNQVINVSKNQYVNLVESATFGFMVGVALLIAHLLKLENPYWVPTSCAAVMQGASTHHIWQRSIQRILGTFVGLGITWFILMLHPTPLIICISIIALQVIVEFLVVRNYGIAVIFITILTIFLAESGNALTINPTALITARFLDILTGSIIGAIGGWILYNERVHYIATRQIRKTQIAISRRK
ncbi:FUSC family protein [Chitinophagaceae bacterium LB-8]|uniref:FUSC family protein n=1 Tax=Paraflavisolibacter caeni TaxID=2982496 RepID=A0A9X2XVE2_9BACT|nr:FUSC family protein [Paraflavisolibacter caeni]MCU7549675.1 FUSC family protein [Paraflavisolibacter caeni]